MSQEPQVLYRTQFNLFFLVPSSISWATGSRKEKIDLFCCWFQVLKDEEMHMIDHAVGFGQRMNERFSQFFLMYINLFRAAQTRGNFRGNRWLSCQRNIGKRALMYSTIQRDFNFILKILFNSWWKTQIHKSEKPVFYH